jgi:hypothetical protein
MRRVLKLGTLNSLLSDHLCFLKQIFLKPETWKERLKLIASEEVGLKA